MHDIEFHAEVDNLTQFADTFTEHEVELAGAERRSHFVLHHTYFHTIADVLVAVLDGLRAADVDTHRGVELQCVATGSSLRIAKEDANLLTKLVDKDAAAVGLADGGRQLAHGLAHQACLQTHLRVSHVAVNLGLGRKGCHRVDDDNIDGTGTDKVVGNLKGLLAVVGLRHQQIVGVHTKLLGIETIECRYAAFLLALGNGMDGQGGLTGRLGAIYLDDATTGETADT